VRRHLLASLGLATAVALTVAACGGAATSKPAPATAPPASEAPASAPPAATGDAVTIANFAFDPATLTVKAGTTVTWTNTDSATHTVAWGDGTPASGPLSAGGSTYARTFDTPGTFAYRCGIHASMTGTIVVEP
jgi:plastocyanin